ncbi:MAG: RNA polymerase factor sigma-54 [Phycisphaerales bacterium]|nr:RNA polymerase factor sigma-54 [Phycisphaerales bacterium]
MSGMRFDNNQSMRLGQQMKLAPKMIQSMEILQMALPALQERIDQELESNAALELVEPGLELEGSEASSVQEEIDRERREEERTDSEGERELVVGHGDDALDFERLDGMEQAYGSELYGDDYGSAMRNASRTAGERDGKIDAMNNAPSRGESLVTQLLKLWAFVDVSEEVAEAGRILIGYVNDDGLLDADLETILEQSGSKSTVELTPELLERALEVVQQELEPPGIAARSVRESLLLQIDAMDPPSDDEEEQVRDDARRLISEWFDDLLENRLPQIERRSGIALERIQVAKDWMHRLELAPGKTLVDVEVRPIIPDVIVEYDPQRDEYVAALANDPLMMLRVSPSYEELAKDRSTDEATRDFVGKSVRNASWLIEAIGQRTNTLLRVVKVVLMRQRDFFDHGPQHLKPLPMVEVAEQLGIHVGTVSRAVADKWMETPRGYFPLRRFFSGGLETDSGKDVSWEAIKEMVREIVEQEDAGKPLSDQAIADLLCERGVTIARRTVVKYREQLGIPSARRRKVHGG